MTREPPDTPADAEVRPDGGERGFASRSTSELRSDGGEPSGTWRASSELRSDGGAEPAARDDPAVVADLEAAAEAYHDAEAAVEAVGRDVLETLQDRHRRARNLLAEYEDKATDTGAREFANFAQFKQQFTGHVEGLDDDLPARDAFEAALDAVDKTRLNERDFEAARDALAPAASLVERLDDLEAARTRLAAARSAAQDRREELHAEIAERERLLELGEADLDAPVEELRDPVECWNRAVRDAFDELRTDAPARELFALLDRAGRYPLVDLPAPPEELAAYVAEAPAGEESVARLLEYADFSRSKLDHYVGDSGAFRRAVATNRTVLERLDAEPLTVAWPPPAADEVPWRVRELRGVAGSLVDDDAVAALRTLADRARDRERYARLRDAAVARAELDADARERLRSGGVEAELATRREAVEHIDEALAEAPTQ